MHPLWVVSVFTVMVVFQPNFVASNAVVGNALDVKNIVIPLIPYCINLELCIQLIELLASFWNMVNK